MRSPPDSITSPGLNFVICKTGGFILILPPALTFDVSANENQINPNHKLPQTHQQPLPTYRMQSNLLGTRHWACHLLKDHVSNTHLFPTPSPSILSPGVCTVSPYLMHSSPTTPPRKPVEIFPYNSSRKYFLTLSDRAGLCGHCALPALPFYRTSSFRRLLPSAEPLAWFQGLSLLQCLAQSQAHSTSLINVC